MMSYSPLFLTITKEIDRLMQDFSHTKKDIGYGYRWTFDNEMRFDLIDYGKKWKNIFRVWRGARLVRTYPILHDRFDDVMKVLAKTEIQTLETLEQKHMVGVLKLLHDAPSGIGAFD